MTSKMRWSVVTFIVCGIVSVAGDGVQARQRATGSDASVEVTRVERSWESAIQKKDSAAVDKILAADWIGLNPDGTLETRSHFLTAVKNTGGIRSAAVTQRRGPPVAGALESETSIRIMPSCLDVRSSSPSPVRLMCRSTREMLPPIV